MQTYDEITDNPERAAAFNRYAEMLRERNEKINLTAITEPEEVKVKHFLDSCSAAELLPGGASVLDIGSGAGFPGLPLKIVRPDLTVTLLDSVNKKVAFVSDVVAELKLSGVTAVHARIEDFPHKGEYDAVVSRAVAELSTLAEYALPFVKIGGAFIAYKSEKAESEAEAAASAITLLGGRIREIREAFVAAGLTRKLIIIDKIAPTPPKYPRGKNLPRLKPLGK
ncbi:MAG TPA: 16S rRNA (guanine(527)-N(7))-methyltransferase RsmG [Clostridiales bacterium]|nr:16S rRNA (guanine(527)-N(7))-methyltransferase RsmG [Clostridiales bacterium]